ncbi:hypothetical protein Neosp_009349 [[Neocosmospora] mangrovei]
MDAPLFCTMQIIDLNHPPFAFEALSYVWGKAKSPEHLFCDDGHLEITVNLDKALRHLRLSSMSRRLWVDAICIDQTDLAERARQVQYMRLVYKRASRTIVWLGEKQDWTEMAIAFAKDLVSLKADFIGNLGLSSSGEAAPAGDPAQTDQSRRSYAYSLLSNVFKGNQEGAEALSKLFGSTDPRDRIFAILGITDEGLEPVYSITESNWLADVARKGYSWMSRRINSISPALEPNRHPALIPNYNKSMREVYQEFTRYCIWKPPRLLTVLGHIQHHEDPETVLDFPSWVPRFDQCRIVNKFIPELFDAGVPTKFQMDVFGMLPTNELIDSAWKDSTSPFGTVTKASSAGDPQMA